MTFPRPILAVVFDMDGLLLDSEVLYRDAIIGVARDWGHDLPLAVFQDMIGTPVDVGVAILRRQFGDDFDARGLFAEASERFHDELDFETLLKTGVRELLDRLDAIGIPKAIATSSPHRAVNEHLGPLGLLERFQAVVAAGDYTNGKPSPDPFLVAAAILDVDPANCLALEDSHNGVRAAHAAGMMTVMVPDLLDPTPEMHDKCVAIAESLHHVREMLDAQALAADAR